MRKVLVVIAVLMATFLLVSCGASVGTESSRGSLGDLQDIEDLRTFFNQDDDAIRLVLLLSPT